MFVFVLLCKKYGIKNTKYKRLLDTLFAHALFGCAYCIHEEVVEVNLVVLSFENKYA